MNLTHVMTFVACFQCFLQSNCPLRLAWNSFGEQPHSRLGLFWPKVLTLVKIRGRGQVARWASSSSCLTSSMGVVTHMGTSSSLVGRPLHCWCPSLLCSMFAMSIVQLYILRDRKVSAAKSLQQWPIHPPWPKIRPWILEYQTIFLDSTSHLYDARILWNHI